MNSVIIRFCLLLLTFSISTYATEDECLQIESFSELASFSSFDADSGYTLANEISKPSHLRSIDNERIKNAEAIDGVSFILGTNFDNDYGLTWDTITINGTGKSYDVYLYEAGGNGSGFIYERGESSTIAASIDEKDISGCITH